MTTPFARRATATLGAICMVAAVFPSTGCRPGNNAAGMLATPPSAADATGQAKCNAQQSASKPLIIEWPGADRAALEGRAARGLVPVRYTGCEMEILLNCSVVDLQYDYLGLTPRSETVAIHDFDELYANLPIGAVKLEAKLERSGQLNVEMMIAGRLEAPPVPRYTGSHLEGVEAQCLTATHVITGITVGAFEFSSGAAAEVGGGVDVNGVAGAGAKSGANKEYLSRGGEFPACKDSEPGSDTAPAKCREMLRVEVVAIERQTSSASTPSSGSSNNGLGAGVLGLRDKPASQADTGASGWTPQLERKLKRTSTAAYVGTGMVVLGGVAALIGFIMKSGSNLSEIGVNGDGNSLAETGDERTKAIRRASMAQPMLWGGYLTLAVGGIIALVALPGAQKLKKQKSAMSARIVPAAGPKAVGGTLEVKF